MEKDKPPDIIESISGNLGAFLRHLLPGVLVLGASFIAYPHSLFSKVDANSWEHIVILGVIALAVGNVLYIFTRYAVHQFFDFLLYKWKSDGPTPSPDSNYFTDLGKYVASSLCSKNIPKLARQHVAFRASSVLFLFIIAETSGIFCYWHEQCSWFGRHQLPTIICAVLAFVAALWQNVITRHIDFHIVDSHWSVENRAPMSDASDQRDSPSNHCIE